MENIPNEKDWANIISYLQKYSVNSLCSLASNSSSDLVRNHAMLLLNESLQNQKALTDIMNNKEWIDPGITSKSSLLRKLHKMEEL